MNTDQIKEEHAALKKNIVVSLRRAAASARKLSRQTKTPFIVYKDGKIVDLNAPRPAKEK